jgi:hypothetical protein
MILSRVALLCQVHQNPLEPRVISDYLSVPSDLARNPTLAFREILILICQREQSCNRLQMLGCRNHIRKNVRQAFQIE